MTSQCCFPVFTCTNQPISVIACIEKCIESCTCRAHIPYFCMAIPDIKST